MSDLSNDTKKHTTKSRETIPADPDLVMMDTDATRHITQFSKSLNTITLINGNLYANF
jgi:hypothetical protein